MKIHGYDKPVKYLRVYFLQGTLKIEFNKYCPFNQDSIIKLNDIPIQFDSSKIGKIGDKGVLYFDKSATFPRYKLEGSSFSRCIKKEKADYIIIGKAIQESIRKSWRTYNVYEDDVCLYITDYLIDNDKELYKHLIGIKKIYSGKVTEYDKYHSLLLENITKPLIWDTDLDEKINNIFPVLTTDDCLQIMSMLDSNDFETIELGIKLITSFNVSATPWTIKSMLILCPKWANHNIANSVVIQTLLRTLQMGTYAARSKDLRALLNFNLTNFTKEDIELSKTILPKGLENHIKAIIASEVQLIEKIGLSVNVTIK